MCRVLSYLGNHIAIEELLYKSDNSLIKQSYNPRHMTHLLNLAGFGLIAWDNSSYNPNLPYIYKTSLLPFYDHNLQNLAAKINAECLLAHIRGVSYSEDGEISMQNVHPFIFKGEKVALAHNGALAEFDSMKFDLLKYIKSDYQKCIKGTTDSEWIYALFLSQLLDSQISLNSIEISNAIIKTFEILQKVRKKRNITITSPVNLFISNGEFIAATRFVFDFGWNPLDQLSSHFAYHSLWYTYGDVYTFQEGEYKMKNGKPKSIIISSEPLTVDSTTWVEVPEYSLVVANFKEGEIEIFSQDIL